MSRQVWKFELPNPDSDPFTIQMPAGAKVVYFAGTADRYLNLWAEVNTTAPLDDYRFAIVGTGWPIPVGAVHLATWIVAPFVWHLYELRRPA